MYTRADILQLAKKQEIEYLRMTFTDLTGTLKNVEIPVELLDAALNNQIKIDGSSITGFTAIENSDMYLHPDLDSWTVYPWLTPAGKTAALICDVYNNDGTPFAGDPRGVLKHLVAQLADLGDGQLQVGAEMEYFLFKADENGKPTKILNDAGSYFDAFPSDACESCRRDTVNTLAKMGFHIEANHHEVAPGQCEIDFRYDNAVLTADRVQLLKLTTRTIAEKHGLCATFMPKPMTGVNGSGMHLNMSLFKDGQNLFADPKAENGLSSTATAYLAGVLAHAQGFTALTNPTINSFKRLVAGYEAPTYVAWAMANRTALVRVPDGRGAATRLELRSGDTSANPYLAMAAVLAAGLAGLQQQLTPPANIEADIFKMTPVQRKAQHITELPRSLSQALVNLQNDSVLVAGLDGIVPKFVAYKQRELTDYQISVTDWENKTYFNV
ncbi:MAG: type I glutamate--ammonia ligase [Lactobacillus sp.]|jgi:glutamine synthetase|nr:type I glutamate--ammonia ligase [Lactobacillus sp.]